MAWERLGYTMGKAGEECGCCLGRVWERPKSVLSVEHILSWSKDLCDNKKASTITPIVSGPR